MEENSPKNKEFDAYWAKKLEDHSKEQQELLNNAIKAVSPEEWRKKLIRPQTQFKELDLVTFESLLGLTVENIYLDEFLWICTKGKRVFKISPAEGEFFTFDWLKHVVTEEIGSIRIWKTYHPRHGFIVGYRLESIYGSFKFTVIYQEDYKFPTISEGQFDA